MGLFSGLFGNNTDMSPESSTGYTDAYNATNKQINKTGKLANQYAGNNGYQNSLNQGRQGAAVTANQAGVQAQRAARNSGMSRGAAAALGASSAADAYGNNFATQQGNALASGNTALDNSVNMANQYNMLANTAAQEKQATYGRSTNNVTNATNLLGTAASVITPIIAAALMSSSDERGKEKHARIDHISDMVTNIPSYMYKYKPEAQAKYGALGADDKEKVGVMAQDLEKNPVTSKAVLEAPNGDKLVDTKQLALQSIGLISDLAKRVQELEGKKD